MVDLTNANTGTTTQQSQQQSQTTSQTTIQVPQTLTVPAQQTYPSNYKEYVLADVANKKPIVIAAPNVDQAIIQSGLPAGTTVFGIYDTSIPAQNLNDWYSKNVNWNFQGGLSFNQYNPADYTASQSYDPISGEAGYSLNPAQYQTYSTITNPTAQDIIGLSNAIQSGGVTKTEGLLFSKLDAISNLRNQISTTQSDINKYASQGDTIREQAKEQQLNVLQQGLDIYSKPGLYESYDVLGIESIASNAEYQSRTQAQQALADYTSQLNAQKQAQEDYRYGLYQQTGIAIANDLTGAQAYQKANDIISSGGLLPSQFASLQSTAPIVVTPGVGAEGYLYKDTTGTIKEAISTPTGILSITPTNTELSNAISQAPIVLSSPLTYQPKTYEESLNIAAEKGAQGTIVGGALGAFIAGEKKIVTDFGNMVLPNTTVSNFANDLFPTDKTSAGTVAGVINSLKTTSFIDVGLAVGSGLALGAAIPVVGAVASKALPEAVSLAGSWIGTAGALELGAYQGYKTYSAYQQAPTPELKGEILGKTAIDLGAFTVGLSAGSAIGKGLTTPEIVNKYYVENNIAYEGNPPLKPEVGSIQVAPAMGVPKELEGTQLSIIQRTGGVKTPEILIDVQSKADIGAKSLFESIGMTKTAAKFEPITLQAQEARTYFNLAAGVGAGDNAILYGKSGRVGSSISRESINTGGSNLIAPEDLTISKFPGETSVRAAGLNYEDTKSLLRLSGGILPEEAQVSQISFESTSFGRKSDYGWTMPTLGKTQTRFSGVSIEVPGYKSGDLFIKPEENNIFTIGTETRETTFPEVNTRARFQGRDILQIKEPIDFGFSNAEFIKGVKEFKDNTGFTSENGEGLLSEQKTNTEVANKNLLQQGKVTSEIGNKLDIEQIGIAKRDIRNSINYLASGLEAPEAGVSALPTIVGGLGLEKSSQIEYGYGYPELKGGFKVNILDTLEQPTLYPPSSPNINILQGKQISLPSFSQSSSNNLLGSAYSNQISMPEKSVGNPILDISPTQTTKYSPIVSPIQSPIMGNPLATLPGQQSRQIILPRLNQPVASGSGLDQPLQFGQQQALQLNQAQIQQPKLSTPTPNVPSFSTPKVPNFNIPFGGIGIPPGLPSFNLRDSYGRRMRKPRGKGRYTPSITGAVFNLSIPRSKTKNTFLGGLDPFQIRGTNIVSGKKRKARRR